MVWEGRIVSGETPRARSCLWLRWGWNALSCHGSPGSSARAVGDAPPCLSMPALTPRVRLPPLWTAEEKNNCGKWGGIFKLSWACWCGGSSLIPGKMRLKAGVEPLLLVFLLKFPYCKMRTSAWVGVVESSPFHGKRETVILHYLQPCIVTISPAE